MTTEEKREVVRVLKHLVGPAFKAVLGRGDGTINVAGRPGYVWCRKLGREELLITAFNRSGATAEGTTVLVRPRTLEGLAEYEVVDPFGAAGTTTTLSGHIAQEPFDAHLNNPCAHVYLTDDEQIANNTTTSIPWDAERFDTDNIWIIGSPTRLTCQTAGIYLIVANIGWDGGAGGRRRVVLRVNGTTNIAANEFAAVADGTTFPAHSVSIPWNMAPGDYMECRVFHTQGAPLDVITAISNFSMVRVG